MPYTTCLECGKPFTDKTVHTYDGWREAQISGYCEDCFDSICDDVDGPSDFDDEVAF